MNNKITFSIFLTFFFISSLGASLRVPEYGSNLNYIHILFEWDQEPNAVGYNIQLSNNLGFTQAAGSSRRI